MATVPLRAKQFGAAALTALALGVGSSDAHLATAGERLAAFQGAAQRYWWSQTPPCGQPQITITALPADRWGDADAATCIIRLNQQTWDWQMQGDPTGATALCVTMVHEHGHLILGPDYFAQSNPDDPAHSPDPNNVMSNRPDRRARVPECAAAQRPRRVTVHHKKRWRLITRVAGVVVAEVGW
jgi:hypothetical protein